MYHGLQYLGFDRLEKCLSQEQLEIFSHRIHQETFNKYFFKAIQMIRKEEKCLFSGRWNH